MMPPQQSPEVNRRVAEPDAQHQPDCEKQSPVDPCRCVGIATMVVEPDTEDADAGYADYRCKWCGKVVQRQSDKAWIKSMCDASGYKTVHLMRVTAPDLRP